MPFDKDRQRLYGPGLIHHGDRGVQYVSIRHTQRLAEVRIEPSVGSVGDSYDNPLVVSQSSFQSASGNVAGSAVPLSAGADDGVGSMMASLPVLPGKSGCSGAR